MKKILPLFLGLFLILPTPASAFVYELVIPERAVIVKFSDDQLMDAYIDALVELEAASAFHQTSGFTPRQYAQHKALIHYRYDLLREIQKRKLKLPEVLPDK